MSKMFFVGLITASLFITFNFVLADDVDLKNDKTECDTVARELATSKVPTKDWKVSFWSGVSTQTKEKEVLDKQKYKEEFDRCMKEKKAEREKCVAKHTTTVPTPSISAPQQTLKEKSNIEQLEELKAMKDRGLITDLEYESKKKEILSRM